MTCFQNIIYGPDLNSNTLSVVFPNSGKHKLVVTPVYTKDPTKVAYYDNILTVETIIYSKTAILPDIETEAARIREILKIPGYKLRLYPVGLGDTLDINDTQADVLGGPFPEEVTVEPLDSNNSILIKWKVRFNTITCASGIANRLLEYTIESAFKVDDEGDLTFELNANYRLSQAFTADLSTLDPIVKILEHGVDKSYQGMTSSTNATISPDRRMITINLSFKEIKSDNAYFPYTNSIECDDELSSSLFGSNILSGKGFYTWSRKISATIRLPQRISKAYAWLVFLQILQQRFTRLYPSSKLKAVFDVTPPAGQLDNDDVTREKDFYLLLALKIKNPIYRREMSFEAVYVVVTDLDSLLLTTKIADRVNTQFTSTEPPLDPFDPAENEEEQPLTLSAQWRAWQVSRENHLNGYFQYIESGVPIVFNQCNNTAEYPTLQTNTLKGLENDPTWNSGVEVPSEKARYPESDGTSEIGDKYSWLTYKNDFEIIERPNTIQVRYLAGQAANYYNTTTVEAASTSRSVKKLQLHGKLTSSANSPGKILKRGATTFYVRMRGSAVRVGGKIPIPSIVTVAGAIATRVGTVRVKHTQVMQGDVPMYLAMWDITYAIDGDIYQDDILSTVVTSGAPAHYQ